jgi:polyisoprenoid-binding protein YceI
MALRSGTYTLGPEDGDLIVETGRDGPAARLGHDLVLVVTRWSATVTVDAEVPARAMVTATVDSGSLSVRKASGGVLGLTDAQKSEVEANIREAVLHSDRHPSITFRSAQVTGGATKGIVMGDLTIARRTRPVTIELRVRRRGATASVTGSAAITQTDFGITLFSAMKGALRVKDVVAVRVTVRLPARP